MKNIQNQNRGISLIEVIVAMAIFLIVVTLAIGGFVSMVRLESKGLIMRETQQNARTALEIIARRARQASLVELIQPPIVGSNPPSYAAIKLTQPTTPQTTDLIKVCNNLLVIDNDEDCTNTPAAIPIMASNNLIVKNLSFTKDNRLLNIKIKIGDNNASDVYSQDDIELETTIILEGEL